MSSSSNHSFLSLKEIETHLKETKGALGTVLMLAKESLQAATKERWDRSMYIAGLEGKLKLSQSDNNNNIIGTR